MKKILIGTHNLGKFKEIAYLISNKYKKISPKMLKIKSPKETGRTFKSNSRLKVQYFSRFSMSSKSSMTTLAADSKFDPILPVIEATLSPDS